MANTIYINEDLPITADGVNVGGSYLNAATITYTLKNAAGTAVASGTGTMTYTAASDGDYTATIDAAVTATLTDGAYYYLEFDISESTYDGFRKLQCFAKYRGAT